MNLKEGKKRVEKERKKKRKKYDDDKMCLSVFLMASIFQERKEKGREATGSRFREKRTFSCQNL